MKLHDLQPDPGARKKRTRVGRGISAGKGKTAGRGTKGAGARGRNARKGPYFEGGQLPLVRRLPFKRGFTNIFRIDYQEVNVYDLQELFKAGETVTPALLAERGLVRDADKPIVVLGTGDLSKALTVKAHRFSKSAAEKIAAAGGSTDKLELKVIGARATVKLLPKAKLAELNKE
ncbi:MAG: 50S ribosomal protein L15 [Phototrophicales bacterium]|nr:MAG: 50S ribosomal protein L15 [Phototrophicales bacterium]